MEGSELTVEKIDKVKNYIMSSTPFSNEALRLEVSFGHSGREEYLQYGGVFKP